MKKLIFKLYLVISISLLTTTASYLTWANSCPDFYDAWGKIPEGSPGNGTYRGMCTGDGIQYVGVFLTALIVTIVFLLVTKFVLKQLGYKITDTK